MPNDATCLLALSVFASTIDRIQHEKNNIQEPSTTFARCKAKAGDATTQEASTEETQTLAGGMGAA